MFHPANPLLADTSLPAFGRIEPAHVLPAVDAVLADYRAALEALTQAPAEPTFESIVVPQEELGDRLARVWAPVSHLHAVKDSAALREVYTEAERRITAFEAERAQNRALYAALCGVRARSDFALRSRAERKLVADAIRDFELSGVGLDEPARSRFRAIETELARLGTEFEQAVLDATDAWYEDHRDPAALAGLPESALALLRSEAEAAGVDGWRVSLKQPSYVAVMTYAEDRALRRRVYEAYGTRASDQGPHAGRWDNGARIEQILALRHEAAQLLGFANAAEHSLATKMAATPERVLGFLEALVRQARPLAEREYAEMVDFAAAELGIADFAPWDSAYAAEKLRQARHALSEEELKPYFPLDAVLGGLYAVAERVFGVRFVARDGVDTWHPDVRYYDLVDGEGRVFAGCYLDPYARAAKRGGAWMDVCRTRRRHAGGTQLPVAFLTCNFAPPTPSTPSLLTHDDVITLFHEFGHGLHHLLTEVDWPSVAGIAGVEWDAVELPSQFMENFCWTREALDLIARHWQTGAPLPDELYERLRAARHFQAGLFLVRQLEFALYDFRLHLEYRPEAGARALELLEAVRREVAVIRPPAWHRFPHAFAHIFAGGYAAGYYSYLWAEVLSADAWSRFEEAGVLDRGTGEAFRRAILAVGGSRPALESFVEFRGREPDTTALLKSYGLAA